MKRKLIVLIVLSIYLIIEAGNSYAQPNFQHPTDYRHYVGYYGEQRATGRHWNLDIVGERGGVIDGKEVRASADGIVEKTGHEKDKSGNYIIIDHGNGWRTTYSHLQDKSTLKEGEDVKSGQPIGKVGKTGNAVGPHLDFGIKHNNQPLNPLDLLWPEKYTCRSQTGCPGKEAAGMPPPDSRPGWRPPDDTFSVADATFPRIPNLEDAYYRLAVKKGKAVVINYYWFKALIKERDTYLENLPDGSIPDQAYLDDLEAEISQLHETFGPNQELFWKEYLETPDIAVLQRGYPDGIESLLGRFKEPVTEIWIDFSPQEVIKHHPVLIIPSGGLYGLQDSAIFKAALDEYVKMGGTLIVFTQPKGIHFSVIPTPDGEPIGAYGWDEDINCFFKGAFLNQYHPIVSSLNKSMPNINIDGHMTSIPDGGIHILTRSINGQPILTVYEHGSGRVIVTTMYTDFAFGVSQAGPDEIAIVRDMVTWAKSPVELPEIRLGGTVSVVVTVENATTTDATSVKLSLFDPDRKTLLSEQIIGQVIPAGQSNIIPVSYPSALTSPLGIYHIDYTLLDVSGNTIQPRAETDMGRFIVTSPPQVGYEGHGITFDILTDKLSYLSGELATFTIRITNHTDIEKSVTVKYEGQEQKVTVAPKGVSSITYTRMASVLYVSFYNAAGIFVGSTYKRPNIYSPSAIIERITPNKTLYFNKGETVTISTTLKNNIPLGWQSTVKMNVISPLYTKVFEETHAVFLSPNGRNSVETSFILPPVSVIGTYSVWVEIYERARRVSFSSTKFELVQSQISISPNLPSVFNMGTNTISFNLTNTGKINVSSGTLDLSLKSPDGSVVYSGSQPFSIAVGESKPLDIPISIPSLKFGNYTLTYTQSDETRTGNPTNITIPSSIEITNLTFDKPSYRIREMANLRVELKNTGKFNHENLSVTVIMPDTGFAETRQLHLAPGQEQNLEYAISIPEGINDGVYEVQVKVALSSGVSRIKNGQLMVPPADIQLAVGPPPYKVGDTGVIQCVNRGGLDSEGFYSIKLYDSSFKLMVDRVGSFLVLAGASSELSFPIPFDLVNGRYFLYAELLDNRTNRKYTLQRGLDLEGITASLEVQTDEEIYLATQDKYALAQITPFRATSVQGNLNLKALLIKPWFSIPSSEASVDTNVIRNMRNLSSVEEISNDYIDLVVTSGGQFTIGTTGGDPGNADDDDARLLYGHPNPWSSFVTVQIDGVNYLLEKELMPTTRSYFSDSSIFTEWRIGNVKVIQRLSIVYSDTGHPDTIKMDYTVQNEDTVAHSVGIRVMLDTQLGYNDGAPFQIPNVGNVTREREYSGDQVPTWLSMNDLSNPTVIGKGILIGLGAVPPDKLVLASWPTIYNTAWDYTVNPERTVTNDSAVGIWWNPQSIAPGQVRKTASFYGVGSVNAQYVVWEKDIPFDLGASGQTTAKMEIPTETVGKFTLLGTLYSSSGQILSQKDKAFYIVPSDIVLLFHTDKKYYRTGETITIEGEVRNLTTLDATSLNVEISEQGLDGVMKTLYTETFDISAGGRHPFTIAATAGALRPVTVTGKLKQNDSTLMEMRDLYEVVNPNVSVSVTLPDVVGNEPFNNNVEMKNTGKVEATVQFGVQSSPAEGSGREFVDSQTITLSAGETKLLQYQQQIRQNMDYTFTFTGDLELTLTKMVHYGLAVSIAINPQVLSPEGNVIVPVTITNTGQLGVVAK